MDSELPGKDDGRRFNTGGFDNPNFPYSHLNSDSPNNPFSRGGNRLRKTKIIIGLSIAIAVIVLVLSKI